MTGQLGLYMGFAIVLAIAYTVKDVTEVVSGDLGQPMGQLCLQVLGRKAGLAMFALNIIAQFTVAQGCTVASSRVVYAYSRDGALPGSRWLKKVNSRTQTPVNSVWFVLVLGALLALLMFASPVAIGAVFSIGAIAQYVAFTLPIALKLFSARDRFKPGKPFSFHHKSNTGPVRDEERYFTFPLKSSHGSHFKTNHLHHRSLEPRPLVHARRHCRMRMGIIHAAYSLLPRL